MNEDPKLIVRAINFELVQPTVYAEDVHSVAEKMRLWEPTTKI